MTAAIAGVATAIAAVAGLLLYLFRTRWSERAGWEKELARLEAENAKARDAYDAAVAAGDPDHLVKLSHWRLCATHVANHRAVGQRAGFLDRAQ